jgi:hypothetical protein
MEKIWKKTMVFTIIGLFIGAGVFPSVNDTVKAEDPEDPPIDFIILDYLDPVDLFIDYSWNVYDFSWYYIETSEYFKPNSLSSSEPLIIIFVNDSLQSDIKDDIYFYCAKLEYIDKDTVVEWVSGGTVEDIKDRILYYYNSGYNVEGAVLVGHLPAAWFYHQCDFDKEPYDGIANPDQFPCDLFLMDLDGAWTDTDNDGMYDSHADGSGNTAPEIYIGRIDASQVPGDEITILEKYFNKVHNYWAGLITGNNVGLTYIDHDWSESPKHLHDISNAYPAYQWMNITTGVNRNDYENTRLTGNYEFIHLSCHSGSTNHYFHTGGIATNTQVRDKHPQALFYNLFCCSSLRFTSANCLGNAYILNTDSPSLAVVGSSKSGSMTEFSGFYTPFGWGYSFGGSFQWWFAGRYPYSGEMGCQTCGDCATDGGGEISWYYGMTILGDPTLYKDPVAIDNIPPSTTISIGAPQYTDGMDDWITPSTSITLTSEDNIGGIGVKEIHYKYDSGSDWTITQGDTVIFTIPDECNHEIQFFAKDDLGNQETTVVKTLIVDGTPPEIKLKDDPIVLWSPNHKYHTIELSDFIEFVEDNKFGDLFANVIITNVTSDEPENGKDDGNTLNDIDIVDEQTVKLRAERQDGKDGRVYTINFKVSDPLGNTASASFKIHVPISIKKEAVDSTANNEGYIVYYP